MTTLVCGSLAYDTIMVFPDQFKKHILPEQIHILNVAFLVPEMRREYGGCAGNIAYNLQLLGGHPLIMATVGDDFEPYAQRLENLGLAQTHVRHVPGNFTGQFSEQLAEVSKVKVKEASQGEMLQPANVYVCPGTHHLRVTPTGRITLDDGPRIAGYRPCADVTLETVATFAGPMGIAVVLTGMGNDGSRGIQAIKSAGGHVLAQDEASSIIFGMPSEAIKTGVVDQVTSIENMYHALEKRVLYIFGAAKVGAL